MYRAAVGQVHVAIFYPLSALVCKNGFPLMLMALNDYNYIAASRDFSMRNNLKVRE